MTDKTRYPRCRVFDCRSHQAIEIAALELSAERPPARMHDLSAQADNQPQALQMRFLTALLAC